MTNGAGLPLLVPLLLFRRNSLALAGRTAARHSLRNVEKLTQPD
jgi:hypothetical protein